MGKFIPRKERSQDQGPNRGYTNVYVKNLGEDFDSYKLLSTFNMFGKTISATVKVDETGKSRGYGFVNFETHDDAAKAVEALNGSVINGRTIYCGRAQRKGKRQRELIRKREDDRKIKRYRRYQGHNLYIKGLEAAKVMRDVNGRSKQFGFVCFSSPEEASKAITEMNGRIIVSKPLYVALARHAEGGTGCQSCCSADGSRKALEPHACRCTRVHCLHK